MSPLDAVRVTGALPATQSPGSSRHLLATFFLTKRAGMGVRGTFAVLGAFYMSRLAQGLLRVFVFRPPWCGPDGDADDGRACVV